MIHGMAGLLPVTTSFKRRRLHLGYRRAWLTEMPFAPRDGSNTGREFHYATLTRAGGRPVAMPEDGEAPRSERRALAPVT